MTTRIQITPFDTCFFRDGKPFTSGEQTEAATLFPPLPSTLFGALRSAYIAENGWNAFLHGDFEQIIGTKDNYQHASFHLKGIFIGDSTGKVYSPLPYDFVVDKEEVKKNVPNVDAYPLRLEQIASNSPFSDVLMNTEHPEKTVEYPSDGAYMQQQYLRQYLLGQYTGIKAITPKRFFDVEPKIGIARNTATMTAEEGHLYRLNMIRLKAGMLNDEDRYHFLTDVEGIKFSASEGMLKFGGEQKAFVYKQVEHRPMIDYTESEKQEFINAIKKTGGVFKLYFATPALWNHADGWRANWMNIGEDRQSYTNPQNGNSVTCQLLTATSGKYQLVGGWDMAANRPKTMYRAVPAGAVYYLKLLAGEPETLFDLFHNQNLSDFRAQEGFGLAYIGVI